jgi:hypothetical protein
MLLGFGLNYTGIGKSALQLSFALLFSSIRASSAKRTISNFRSNSWRRTCNSQKRCGTTTASACPGGSSCSSSRDCDISGQYCRNCASVSNLFHTWSFSDLSLRFPAGHMERSSNGCCSLDSARVTSKPGAGGKSAHDLSFILLFSSIREFSAKRTISNFRSNSWQAGDIALGGAIFARDRAKVEIYNSAFESNTAPYVSCTNRFSEVS